jgi:RHS repeat-associated protein
LNRLKQLTSKRGAIELSKYVYTIDKVGNRKTATESVNGQARSINYTYDDLYRLTGEAITDSVNGNRTSGYTYDNVGNRLTKTVNGVTTTYEYDGNDRLLNEKVGGATTATYSYDNNGSTLTKTENGVTTTYTWNDEKRLISATVGTQTVDYAYNDRGIRVSSKQNGVETRYLLNEGIVANVWEEHAPDGTVQASYVYGYDLITQTQAGQTSYYLVDGLGSTRLLTDSAGQVLNAYGYEAFGESTSQSGSTSNKYQYAGEQFDAALGDYYLRQRFYDPGSGRFSRMDTWEGKQEDPLTLHKYIYAHNNPSNLLDPTGFSSEFAPGGGLALRSVIENILFAALFATIGTIVVVTGVMAIEKAKGAALAINGKAIRGNTVQVAIHLARLLRLSEVGGQPPDEDPDPGDDNDKHWWKEIKTFLKNVQKALDGASRKQAMRELLKEFTEEQIDDIVQRLAEAASKMGDDLPPFIP